MLNHIMKNWKYSNFCTVRRGGLVEKNRNVAEDESIFDSIDESSIYSDSDGRSISTNDFEDMQGGNYVHPDINARDTRVKIYDHNRQAQSEWK